MVWAVRVSGGRRCCCQVLSLLRPFLSFPKAFSHCALERRAVLASRPALGDDGGLRCECRADRRWPGTEVDQRSRRVEKGVQGGRTDVIKI